MDEKNESIAADDNAFPETEEVVEEDKTEGESKEEPENKDEGEKPRRSEIAQKKHWREKAEKANSKVKDLEEELSKLRGMQKPPSDEAERKAQEYIRNEAKQVYLELQKEKAKEESERESKLNSEVESILEDNPDIVEAELLDAIDEYEVEPSVALKILQKQGVQVKKPKMPAPKRAPSENKALPDDSKKSMFDILKEEISAGKGK